MSGFLIAAEQKSHPCNLTENEAVDLNVDPATDIHALQQYQEAASAMLKHAEFDQLDCLANQARSSKQRFPGGVWKLHMLYAGLEAPVQVPQHATDEDWSARLDQLTAWVSARPQSITALVALAAFYDQYAWAARGDGYAHTVSDSGWKLFAERTAEAHRLLDQAKAMPTTCPEWYVSMLRTGQNQSWNVSEMRRLYEEATKFEPGYYYYARMMANYLLPKWSGAPGDAEKFTQEAADAIGGAEGDILYFQVASFIACGCEDELHLSWGRVVTGFETSEKQYGVSMLNLNIIAYLATNFPQPDPVVADKALARIGAQWDEGKWQTRKNFDTAKDWAAGAAPLVAGRRDMEGQAEANAKTGEGALYKAAFEKKYRKLVEQCVKKEGGSQDKFKTFTNIGAGGTVKEIKIFWNGSAAICVYQKLHAFQLAKKTAFPPPPYAPYWVRLDFDGSASSAEASR